MFENLSHLELQQYWWIIISLLGAILVFMMFVQGGQTLISQVAKSKDERSILINTIGRKWDLTFTTLVTFGGAFFASFPLFYSTSFGGAYWVWSLILFSFIVQAVSYEYRTKAGNFLGTKTYDSFLVANGIIATILIGAAVGTFFTGSEFSVDMSRITDPSSPVISRWETSTYGLEAALNFTNLLLGLTVFFLSRVLGLLYFIKTIESDSIYESCIRNLKSNVITFLAIFLSFLAILFTSEGFTVNTETNTVEMEQYKYISNLVSMPLVLVLFLLGVVSVLYSFFITLFKQSKNGIWYAGAGTIAVVFSLFLVAGFNNTAFYPSTFDLASSLTIQNSSSSHFTLTVMSYVSLFVPFVIAYIWYTWKAMSKQKVSATDLENDEMKY